MIRHYEGGDEQAIVALWNRAMPADPVTLPLIVRRVLTDPNFDPEGVIVWEENGEVAGFLLAVVRQLPMAGTNLEPEDGWITAFAVAPESRGRGAGSAMLTAADEFFHKRGRRRVSFSPYAPNYFLPGIDPAEYPAGKGLLEKAGFRTLHQAVAMDKELVGFRYPDDVREAERRLQDDGYVFERLTLPHLTALVRFNQEFFGPDWARAVRGGVAGSLALDRFLIARRGRDIAGFCMYGLYDGIAERFGPFGVHPQLQGIGLGKVLLYRCLEAMRGDGLHTAWFLWTGETSPAGHLYRRAGFHVSRRFEIMRKEGV